MHEKDGTFEGFENELPHPAESEHPVLTALKFRIEALENSIESKNDLLISQRDRIEKLNSENVAFGQDLRNILLALVQDQEITTDVAERIVKACGLELTKTVSFSGTVNFSGTIEVPLFTDETEIYYNTDIDDFSLDVFGETVRDLDYELENVDVDSIS